MKQKIFLLLFLASCLFLSTCKNELNLNAPYKELPSVYAVINPQESVHMIRVNKIFLGTGDANAMAKVADSVNYPAGELTITLDRFVSGQQVNASPIHPNPAKRRTIVFRDSVIQAQPGSFNSTQRVYVSYDDLHEGKAVVTSTNMLNVNPNWRAYGEYVLTIKNNRTGNIYKARANAVDSVIPRNQPLLCYCYPYPADISPFLDADKFVDYTETEKLYDVRFNPVGAEVYQVLMRFHFNEVFGTSIGYRYIDYEGNFLYPKDARKLAGSTYLVSDFRGKDIYSAIQAGMKRMGLDDNVKSRKMYMIEYFVYSSTQDYVDYQEFVKPSFNISQNKPLYSNFENRDALGIFTFRSRCLVRKQMSPPYLNSFSSNPSTCYYKFVDVNDKYLGCK